MLESARRGRHPFELLTLAGTVPVRSAHPVSRHAKRTPTILLRLARARRRNHKLVAAVRLRAPGTDNPCDGLSFRVKIHAFHSIGPRARGPFLLARIGGGMKGGMTRLAFAVAAVLLVCGPASAQS